MLLELGKQVYGSSLKANRLLSRAMLARQNFRLYQPRFFPSDSYQATTTVENRLPPLAWICRREGPRFDFTVGPGVEVFADGLFEGVWTGDFNRFDQIADSTHFGSGAAFQKHVLFIPPKHMLEYLFIFRDKRRKVDFISNSVCFCLAECGIKCGSAPFEKIADTLVKSTKDATRRTVYGYDPLVTQDEDFAFFRIFYNNFFITPDGMISFSQPYLGREFKDFHEYRGFLSSNTAALISNAMHPKRHQLLPPISSVSSGYDSAAVAALSKENGCQEAVTMKVKVLGVQDSGREVSEQLGLRVQEFTHVAGQEIESLVMKYDGELKEKSMEFIATAGIGDDIGFLSFETVIQRKLLFTGQWGDYIWAKDAHLVPGLPKHGPFAKSLTEFRLRLGFAHVPAPIFGALFPRSIIEISNSVEMRPYSVGGSYDRPIPRRILEDAGVRRGSFGCAKAATAPDPLNRRALWREAVEHIMQRYSHASVNLVD